MSYSETEAALIKENAALRAEVARLSTWVEVDYAALKNINDESCVRWFATPCACLVYNASSEEPILDYKEGEMICVLRSEPIRYLPITLPGEGK